MVVEVKQEIKIFLEVSCFSHVAEVVSKKGPAFFVRGAAMRGKPRVAAGQPGQPGVACSVVFYCFSVKTLPFRSAAW